MRNNKSKYLKRKRKNKAGLRRADKKDKVDILA